MTPAALLVALWLGPAVKVVSVGACPRADDVSARLDAILPQVGRTSAAADVASVDTVGAHLRITLTTHAGVLIGRRTIERVGSCADLAAAAAVIIASWETTQHPEFLSGLPPRVAVPAAVVAPQPSVPEAGATGPAKTPQPGSNNWDLGGAIGGTAAGDIQPSASIAGTWVGPWSVGNGRAQIGIRLGLAGSLRHRQALAPGEALWRRSPVTLGPVLRLPLRAVVLDCHADAALGLLQVGGSGFQTNVAHQSLTFGLGSGLRLALARPRVTPYLAAHALFWPQRDTVRPAGGAPVALSRWEGTVSGGAMFRF